MRLLAIIGLLAVAAVPSPHVKISTAGDKHNFALDRPAVVTFVVQNTGALELEVSGGAIVDLKDKKGEEYTAPFEIATLKPRQFGTNYGLKLQPHQEIRNPS